MKLHFFTIALDGMPWITYSLPTLNKLAHDWTWTIVEGVAAPRNCTSWCQEIEPRLSKDGTSQYLDLIKSHPRVKVIRQRYWEEGKLEMCNAAMETITEPCLLWQLDADEIWCPSSIERVVDLFGSESRWQSASFICRFFLGLDIATQTIDHYGNYTATEWRRAWKVKPGQFFTRHEPPIMDGIDPAFELSAKNTFKMGITFDHYAYATEAQVRFKEEFYGYKGAVKAWRALQQNTVWPTKLRDWLPWVTDEAVADRIYR